MNDKIEHLDNEGDYLEAAIERRIAELEAKLPELSKPSRLPDLLSRMGTLGRSAW